MLRQSAGEKVIGLWVMVWEALLFRVGIRNTVGTVLGMRLLERLTLGYKMGDGPIFDTYSNSKLITLFVSFEKLNGLFSWMHEQTVVPNPINRPDRVLMMRTHTQRDKRQHVH
uniref:Uncharacterized protein n=1 Tax=Cacopsylla melanoneura TaxID=428564 RepID=A0A8D9EYX2_9HEMI